MLARSPVCRPMVVPPQVAALLLTGPTIASNDELCSITTNAVIILVVLAIAACVSGLAAPSTALVSRSMTIAPGAVIGGTGRSAAEREPAAAVIQTAATPSR